MNPLEDALRFGGFTLAHATWIVSDLEEGELLCPIAVVTKDDERKVIPFESDSQAEAIERGKNSLEELKDSVDRWAFAREGLLSIEETNDPKQDVIAVSAWVQGLDEPIILQQIFKPKASGIFSLIGPIRIAIHGQRPTEDVQLGLRLIAMQGVASHPHGSQWRRWANATV
jgi:hypothetical protein